MYSCDLNNRWYQDPSYPTGFVVEKAKEHITGKVKHTLLTGGYAPEFLPEIGKGIDFLILDTAHSLPGEMLDFLACLPYLAPNAVVVLHDVSMNVTITKHSYATKMVFDTVVADKILMPASERPSSFPNIGAFRINEDTMKYIGDVFSALTITWRYLPDGKELKLYHDFLLTEYDASLVEVYDKAVLLQVWIACKEFKDMGWHYDVLLNKWRNAKHVIIYGCGKWGKCFFALAKENNLPVDCFVISDGRTIPELEGVTVPVMHLSDVSVDKKECLVLLMVEKGVTEREVIWDLIERGYEDIY